MTKALAKDLIQKNGIRVNAVAPGPIWTPIPVESFTEEMVRSLLLLVLLSDTESWIFNLRDFIAPSLSYRLCA